MIGGTRLARRLCQKLSKNCTIAKHILTLYYLISAFFQKIALIEVLMEPYKNRVIARIALIEVRDIQGFPAVVQYVVWKNGFCKGYLVLL